MSHKLIFKTIRAKNFRSISNNELELIYNQSPTTLIGSDDNGAGKSTLLVHALYYCLFDKAYGEDCKKTALINSRNNKDCLVTVEFTVKGSHWLVKRGMKPAVFDVIKDGVRVEDEAATRDYQKYLQSVIGMDEKLFCNSIALGKDRFVPFASMTASDRRNYVEQILDIVVFSSMNELTKEEVKTNNRLKTDIEYKISLGTTKIAQHYRVIQLIQDQIEKKKKDNSGQVDVIKADVAEQISKLQTELVESVNKLSDELIVAQQLASDNLAAVIPLHENFLIKIKEKKDEIAAFPSTLDADRTKYQNMLTQFKTKMSMNEKSKNDFISMDVCPNCRQHVTEHIKQQVCDELQPTIDTMAAGIEQLNEKLIGLNAQIDNLNKVKAELSPMERGELELRQKITVLKQNQESLISSHDRQVTNLKSSTNSQINNLSALLKRQLEELEKAANSDEENGKLAEENVSLVNEQTIMTANQLKSDEVVLHGINLNNLLEMLKDDGVKAQIVKQYIPLLNQKINEYLDKMNLYINFTMDEEFKVEMFAPDRKGQTLGNLSTGQLRRIDLSVLLAWRDIARIKSSVDCNLLILDEVLENLSEQGVADFMGFWKEHYKSKDTNLFVVSQRKNEFEEHFDTMISYTLKDGFTEQK